MHACLLRAGRIWLVALVPTLRPICPLVACRPSYVRYMSAIRCIQDYLGRKAEKAQLPRVENTNVDRSVGVIHLTVMG
jgi:hypothetical protein